MTELVDLRQRGYVQYDAAGRVISRGNASQHVLDLFTAQGMSILLAPIVAITLEAETIRDDVYVDLLGVSPRLMPRPTWQGMFNPAPVLPKQEATLPQVPACSVAITGPVTASYNHPGGDLKLGFTLPGVYTITFEAFPYLAVTRTLTVNPATTVNATANTSTKL